MSFTEDLARLALQEAELLLPVLDFDSAWSLGNTARDLARSRNRPVVIDVRRFGQPSQPLFYAALAGTTPDAPRWIERKSHTVARFHRSSYAVGVALLQAARTLGEKYSLPESEYAAHGGSIPLHVSGAGIVGALTISGLPQREDHNLAVEALCLHLGRSYEPLRLP